MIDALYAASQAGVSIDLIIRGICRLVPGVPGLSENIRVRSIVGRYLEHSRIFRFGGLDGRPLRLYIGSADLMERNLDRRIEALAPVRDPELQSRLVEILQLNLTDDVNTWALESDGTWIRVPTAAGVSLQSRLQELAIDRARRRREPKSRPELRPGSA